MTKLLNHINTYQSEADYQNDNSKNFPNVSYIEEDDIVMFAGIRYEQQYFAIESLEDDNAVMFKLSSESGSPDASSAKTISVSTDDGETWTDYTSTKEGTTIATLNMGQKVLIKGNNDTYYKSGGWRGGYNHFTASKEFDVNGNIMSLIYGDNFKEQYSFPSGTTYNFGSFFISAPVVSAENLILPATTLANYCYYQMFTYCNHLVNAPALPATTLANNCYQNMFYGCTNLVNTPQLPATTLASWCYSNMFNRCTSLVTAPELPATTLASGCYNAMFFKTNIIPEFPNIDFTSQINVNGEFTGLFAGTNITDADLERILPKNANGKYCLPATTLANNCYTYMFQGCTSLTTAPQLPATTLASWCYGYMFDGCTSLTSAPQLPATTLANYCYSNMFNRCTSLVNAPELPATTLANNCYQNMFDGCTSLVNAPTLPATTLADNCYYYMFKGCTNLTSAPQLPATRLAEGCYGYMFNGCTSLRTAPTLPAKILYINSYSFMFQGCRSLNYIKAMFTNLPNTSFTTSWVDGVASSGTFVKNKAAEWNVTGVNGIPTGWTVQKASS